MFATFCESVEQMSFDKKEELKTITGCDGIFRKSIILTYNCLRHLLYTYHLRPKKRLRCSSLFNIVFRAVYRKHSTSQSYRKDLLIRVNDYDDTTYALVKR